MTDLSQRIAHLSPEKRALLEARLAQVAAAKNNMEALNRSDDGILEPSFGQEMLWVQEQLEGGSAQFNICFSFHLEGSLDTVALQQALLSLVHRHLTLRTRFLMGTDGDLRLELAAFSEYPLKTVDYRSITESERDELLAITLRAEANTPIALEGGLLIRAVLYQLESSQHVLQLTMHHAAVDGWSLGILFNDFSAMYNAHLVGEIAQLPQIPITFSDYARWQRSRMAGPEGERLLSYWKNKIQGSSFTLQLPTDFPRPLMQTFCGASRSYSFPAPLASALHEFCLREKVTPFMVLLSAFFAVMARYTGQDDIIVGSPIAARSRTETEEIIGYFTNTVLLRGKLDGNPTFRELLNRVRTTALEAYSHEDLPLELLVRELAPERDPSRSVFFQTMMVYQNTPAQKLELHGLKTSVRNLHNNTSKLDFTIELIPAGTAIDAVIEYNTDLFEAASIDRLWGHLIGYLQNAIASAEQFAARIPLLTSEEEQQFAEWNATQKSYPRDFSLAALVEAQVERTPDAIAVVDATERITYRQLNERANQLAHELIRRGAGPDQLVGLCVERSAEMIAALLGILKSGAGYLPLDPFLPADRLSFMLEDSGIQLLVTVQHLRSNLPMNAATIVLMNDPFLLANSRDNPSVAVNPEHLAYVIYTSGSTGKPKGVQISRAALANLLWAMRDLFQLSESDRILALTTISFDIAGAEIWLPLLVGAQIVVVSRDSAMDGNALRELIELHDITFLQATPVTWRILFEAGWQGRPQMQAVCTGEAMPSEIAAQLVPAVKRLWNLYGPTETTIWSTGCIVTDAHAPILIGRPLANTQCHILDAHGQRLPIGAVGELYIGGDGLARGYLNRPELTAERFLRDPFRPAPARIYRTGDLARYKADGSIECLGRIDHQIKLRGYRIEPGEIEAALCELPEIEQAAVVVREDAMGDKLLVACMVSSCEAVLQPSELRMRLKRTLPDYMIPSTFVYLPQLPISSNGKLDRNALLASTEPQRLPERGFVAPRNPCEQRLAGIWAEVLEVPRIGVEDDFFALGGDSLRAVRLLVKIRAAFPKCQLALATILKAATVAQFARYLDEDHSDWPCLVALREGTRRPPLFSVNGAGGNVLSLRDLALALPPDQPFYSLQERGLDGQSTPFASVEEAAECYVNEISKLQLHGPYYLVGGCFGGLVVFEMARKLRALGEPVGVVALIDTRNLHYGRSLPVAKLLIVNLRFLLLRSFHHLKVLAKMKNQERSRYLLDRFKVLQRYSRNLILFATGKTRAWQQTTNQTIAIEFGDGMKDLGSVLNRVRAASLEAAYSYIPEPYDGHVHVFRARNRKADPYRDETLGWRSVVQGGVTAYAIDGDHLSIFRHPDVAEVAQKLDAALLEAQRENQG